MITESPSWRALNKQSDRLFDISINNLFITDPQRFEKFSLNACDILYDFSKQKLDQQVINVLLELAQHNELSDRIIDLFKGANINKTENRPALHTRLREPKPSQEIKKVQDKIKSFVEQIHSGEFSSITGKRIKYILSLGIGGSDLGPVMACNALQAFKISDLEIYFVSNVDGETLDKVLAKLKPDETICLINSKTFTTPETLCNANTVKLWFSKHLGDQSIAKHIFGITANSSKAQEFGIDAQNIFEFWEWVGGRYSIWSAVGIPIALSVGFDRFQDFLAGAYAMDQHFKTAKFNENIPVLMALIGIWNINFLKYNTLAIMPYLDCLKYFPAYLQQLEMESNGKIAINSGGYASYATAPIVWGGVGCDGQHAYMQLLHQGSQIVPIDFIAAINSHSNLRDQQDLLLTSCLAQSRALMQGCSEKKLLQTNSIDLAQAKMCMGNRPTSTLLLTELTPYTLGALIALYEHKVFVQGIIWQIQSFDQWGVELGKRIAKSLLPMVRGDGFECQGEEAEDLKDELKDELKDLDSSTCGLLEYIRGSRG